MGARQASEGGREGGVSWVPGSARTSGLRASRVMLGPTELLVLTYEVPRLRLSVHLTKTEHEIVRGVVSGRSNAEIARGRRRSPRTIANQLAAIYRKLGIHSRLQLIAVCASGVPR